jgi:hypothetical protein
MATLPSEIGTDAKAHVAALQAVENLLTTYNQSSPSETGYKVESIPGGHPLHVAIVHLQGFYGGFLPVPARTYWRKLLRLSRADNENAELFAGRLLEWVQGKLARVQPASDASGQGNDGAGEDMRPRNYLVNWREIAIAVGMKDNQEDKAKIKAMSNNDPDSPIIIPKQGAQPKVDKAKLLAWWNGLEKKYQESQRRERDQKATVAAQHPFGRDGIVAPDIGGGIKRKRRATK